MTTRFISRLAVLLPLLASRLVAFGQGRQLITPTVVGAAAAGFGTFSIVLGSGILPVPMLHLMAASVPLGALVGVALGCIFPVNWSWSRVSLSFVFATWIAVALFRRVVDQALTVAENYTEHVAALIEHQAAISGKWPADLLQVPGVALIPAPPEPWLAFTDGDIPKIAGFFIHYQSEPPRISVARRGYGALYDLRTKKWQGRRPAA